MSAETALREARKDHPDCSKCGHPSVLHNGPKLLCAAVFRGAWGPCTCPGYEVRAALASPESRLLDEAWLAKEIARAMTLMRLEGNQPNESYGRSIAEYLVTSARLRAEIND